jgi:magnesium-transporting ATPase (P-type)
MTFLRHQKHHGGNTDLKRSVNDFTYALTIPFMDLMEVCSAVAIAHCVRSRVPLMRNIYYVYAVLLFAFHFLSIASVCFFHQNYFSLLKLFFLLLWNCHVYATLLYESRDVTSKLPNVLLSLP